MVVVEGIRIGKEDEVDVGGMSKGDDLRAKFVKVNGVKRLVVNLPVTTGISTVLTRRSANSAAEMKDDNIKADVGGKQDGDCRKSRIAEPPTSVKCAVNRGTTRTSRAEFSPAPK